MGQEHISYIIGYSNEVRIDFLCEPFEKSLVEAEKLMQNNRTHQPAFLSKEEELLANADNIDLLVIASPNYMHTPTLLKWGSHDITILCEKPMAVSQDNMMNW
jgi:predicted dehydrogenase